MKELFAMGAEWSQRGIFIRLIFAMIVGIVVGINREMKRRGAGIKTHTLVCIGSALVMITSEYMMHQFPDQKFDLARLGAQVISGVGFLGVGCIIITGRNQIRGLTTAAGLWACACVGLACGIGFIEGAVYALLLIVFTFVFLTKADLILSNHSKTIHCYVEFTSNREVGQFIEALREMDLKVSSFEMVKSKIKGEGPTALITLELDQAMRKNRVIPEIRALACVRYAEEL